MPIKNSLHQYPANHSVSSGQVITPWSSPFLTNGCMTDNVNDCRQNATFSIKNQPVPIDSLHNSLTIHKKIKNRELAQQLLVFDRNFII